MPSLFRLTRDIESRLHALLAELQEVKSKARRLEQENADLRKELAGLRGDESNGMELEQQGNKLNLLKLYDQGFHVCNMYFGEERNTDCLFCMAFLRIEIDNK
ncbi:MAG: DNA replication initiation control protein YabA [Peptococcaceae bacterium]|nr:DNA replication initiation control protein YabA [Peptococcaceae bacterium]